MKNIIRKEVIKNELEQNLKIAIKQVEFLESIKYKTTKKGEPFKNIKQNFLIEGGSINFTPYPSIMNTIALYNEDCDLNYEDRKITLYMEGNYTLEDVKNEISKIVAYKNKYIQGLKEDLKNFNKVDEIESLLQQVKEVAKDFNSLQYEIANELRKFYTWVI